MPLIERDKAFIDLIKDLNDPLNYLKASAKMVGGAIKGALLGYVDPNKGSVTNPFTNQEFNYPPLPSVIDNAIGNKGSLDKEVENSKFAAGLGELLGMVAPFTAIDRLAAIPIKALPVVANAARTLQAINAGAKVGRTASITAKGVSALATLAEAAGTGATYGFIEKPGEIEPGQSLLDARTKTAVQDAIVFPALTGAFMGGRGLLRAVRGKWNSMLGKEAASKLEPVARPDADVAGAIELEAPPPIRSMEIPLLSRYEYSKALDLIETTPGNRNKLIQEVLPQIPQKEVIKSLEARAAMSAELKATTPMAELDYYPLKLEIPTKEINPANITEQLQVNKAKFTDMYEPQATNDYTNAIKDKLFERHGELGVQKFRTFQFTSELKKKLSEPVREDLTFYLEKTGNPYLANDTFEALSTRLSPEAKEAANTIRGRLDNMRETINASGYSNDVGFLQDYITHRWQANTKQARILAQRFMRKNPFANARSYATFEQGIKEAGLTPITTDVADIVSYYENVSNRVIANNKLVKELQSITDEEGRPLLVSTKRVADSKGVQDYGDYQKIDNASFESYKAHPQLAKDLEVILGKPFDNEAVRKLQKLNAFAKKSALSLSFFHHMALTEEAIALLGVKGLRPFKIAKEGLEIMRKAANSEYAIRSGLEIGALTDVQASLVDSTLKSVENSAKNIPLIGRAAGGAIGLVRKGNQAWDRFLWDYYHTGLKAYAFNELTQKALTDLPHIDSKVIGKKVAELVNDAFGGQNWELLMKTPKWRQAAHLAILAPDWTLSKVRIATKPFQGLFKKYPDTRLGGHEKEIDAKIREFSKWYWTRAALSGYTFSNLLNMAFTKYQYGKAKFMWENDPGHMSGIELPWRDEKGRKRYIELGKQFREPIHWIAEPVATLGNKLSPLVQAIVEQTTGSTTRGFPLEFKDKPFYKTLPERGEALAEKFAPISFQANNFAFAIPSTKGMTNFKTTNMLEKALEDNDANEYKRVVEAAVENNLDVKKSIQIAKSRHRAKKKKQFLETLQK